MTQFCDNSPCETEATCFYTTDTGGRFHLCYTCKEAFELGQVNQDAEVEDIDSDDDLKSLQDQINSHF